MLIVTEFARSLLDEVYMVARCVWDAEAASSTLAIQTSKTETRKLVSRESGSLVGFTHG